MSPPSNAALARRLRVTVRTVQRWRAAGAPVQDAAALARWRSARGRREAQPKEPSWAELEAGLLRDALRLIAKGQE